MERTYRCCACGNIYININYEHDRLHFEQHLSQTTKTNMVLYLAINKVPPFRKFVFPMSLSKMESFEAEKRSSEFSLPRESVERIRKKQRKRHLSLNLKTFYSSLRF